MCFLLCNFIQCSIETPEYLKIISTFFSRDGLSICMNKTKALTSLQEKGALSFLTVWPEL